MLKTKYSNHHFASQNETAFYNILFALKYENEDILSKVIENIDMDNIELFRKFPWTYINFKKNNYDKRTLTWKIHISAVHEKFIDTLNVVILYCNQKKLNYKFVSSSKGFNYINGKTISPASAGKSIVIYCLDNPMEKILEDLYKLLKGYRGPYILSDQQYKDSEVLYYRYGEYLPISIISEEGLTENYVFDNNFRLQKDVRMPYYNIFDWVNDIDLSSSNNIFESELLKKYQIKEIIANRGSITCYSGVNNLNGEKIFIKEGRSFLGIDSAGLYSTERLKKEYDFLYQIKDYGISANPIDYIEEGGNAYIVEEFLEGQPLTEWLSLNNFLYRCNCTDSEKRLLLNNINHVMLGIVKIFYRLYNQNIFLNDISFNNILVNKNLDVKVIDFEYAFNIEDDNKANVYTAGFSSNILDNVIEAEIDKIEKLISYLYIPFNNTYSFSENKKYEFLKWYLSNYQEFLPRESKIILFKILNRAIKTFEDFIDFNFNTDALELEYTSIRKIDEIIYESIEGIISSFNNDLHENKNYIFPADPQLFNTNLFSISHGSLGILYCLSIMKKRYSFNFEHIKEKTLHITLPRILSSNRLSNGLYIGKSGMAWSLLELGYQDIAEKIQESANNFITLKRVDYFYGLSGLLISNIKFFLHTKKKEYKYKADTIFEKLAHLTQYDLLSNSLGEGFSGISLALIYYGRAFASSNALELAKKYIDFELSRIIFDERGKIGINREGQDSALKVLSPYIYDGIAGVGVVLTRIYAITREKNYLDYLLNIIDSSLYDITIFPTYMRGMSGIMDFLMDTLYVVDDLTIRNKIMDKLKILSENLQLFYSSEKNLFFW